MNGPAGGSWLCRGTGQISLWWSCVFIHAFDRGGQLDVLGRLRLDLGVKTPEFRLDLDTFRYAQLLPQGTGWCETGSDFPP